jgi:alcohol dehydrogenase
MRMQACVVRQGGAEHPFTESQPISVEEIELSPPGPEEMLVRIGGAGLCHSDLSILNGARGRAFPLVLGHEGAGEVVETGSGITDVQVGDHVVFQFSASCGRCRRCMEGRPQICQLASAVRSKGQLLSGAHRLHDLEGNVLNHQSGVSCFAEYAVVHRGSVVVIDKSLPLHEAAIFGCAVMTGAGAVLNTARIRAGDTVAIVGLGGVGLNGLLGAKLAGAETIVAIDLSDAKLGLASQLGATHTVNASDPDHVEQVRELTAGGVDFAFDLAGSIAAMETAYKCACHGGSVVSAGLSPSGAQFSFEQGDLVSQEKSIRGSYMGSCVPVRDIPRFVKLYQQGRFPVDRLIDSTIGLNEVNAGFDKLSANATVRQICVPH